MNAPNQTSYLILQYHKIRGFFREKREARVIDKTQLQPLHKIIMCLIQNILVYIIFSLSAFHFKSTQIDFYIFHRIRKISYFRHLCHNNHLATAYLTPFRHDSHFKNIKIFESTAPVFRGRDLWTNTTNRCCC